MKKGITFALFLALHLFRPLSLLDASLAYPPRARVCTEESKNSLLLS
jgi:hypothetical protein